MQLVKDDVSKGDSETKSENKLDEIGVWWVSEVSKQLT